MSDTRTAATEPFRQRQADYADWYGADSRLAAQSAIRLIRAYALNHLQAEAQIVGAAAIASGII